jgi:ketosteroid isomerase-like protein
MPGGNLGTAYAALGAGDSGPLLDMLGRDFEWVEPELAGYPLAGVHRGPDGVSHGVLEPLQSLFEDLTIDLHEVVETDARTVVTGALRGRPAGADADWELAFAHVWELDGGLPVRVTTYFDRSRLTLAAARRQLADVADDLLEQAAEIRRQWARLGDALRAAGVEADEAGEAFDEDDDAAPAPFAGPASVRLAAVDMAQEGATREEVDVYLRDEHGVEDTAPILDEVFGVSAGELPEDALGESAAAIEANRLSRLFSRR